MPKRPSVSSAKGDESPRKSTRRSSKSPIKSNGNKGAAAAAIIEDDDLPPPPTTTVPEEELTNISDEEEMEIGSSSKGQEENRKNTKGPTVPLDSLAGLRVFRGRFFEKFVSDITRTEEGVPYGLEAYKGLCDEVPDDDPVEHKTLVDQYMRDFALEKADIMKDHWSRFLELSIQLAKNQICSASLPVSLTSDFLELSTLERCEDIFYFVEQRLDVWKDPFFLNSGKNSVLRMCNDLLRRLSRAQNTIFCGRILLFLSNYFPFSERSGLNIMSEFNTENVTSYKKGDGSDDPEDQMEIAEERDEKLFEGMNIMIPGLDKIVLITQEEKKKKVKLDYSLYVKFWSLQDFFRNPSQCYNKVTWKSFSVYINDVLGAFASYKLEANRAAAASSSKSKSSLSLNESHIHKSHSSINVVPKLSDDDLFFPKYLTNRRLLELQIGDPSFRKYFLVQLLIILQYLTSTVKFKNESQTLSDDQLEFVRKTAEKIYSLLKDIKPGGKEFVKSVQHILKREDMWNKWKNDGCQPFKKPVASGPVESEGRSDKTKGGDQDLNPDIEAEVQMGPPSPKKKRSLGDLIADASKTNRFLLGNPELTRLWNICGDNLQACRTENRDFCPKMENYFVDAFQELDPEPTPPHIVNDPSKREVKPKKNLSNANFGWRALRLLAKNSPYFFQLAPSPPIQPMQNYLEYILKKVATDMEIPTPTTEKPDNGVENGALPNGTKQDNATANVDGDQVMEGDADAENDELLKSDLTHEREKDEEEEGEVDEKVRNLTDEEQKNVGRLLGEQWKKVATKLQFTKDEIEYFETERGKEAGAWMLKMWTEQEKDDATVADLLYQLEGLKLRELVQEIFPI